LFDELVKPFFSKRVRTGSAVEDCFILVNWNGAKVTLCMGVCRLVMLTNARESLSLTSDERCSVFSLSYLNKS